MAEEGPGIDGAVRVDTEELPLLAGKRGPLAHSCPGAFPFDGFGVVEKLGKDNVCVLRGRREPLQALAEECIASGAERVGVRCSYKVGGRGHRPRSPSVDSRLENARGQVFTIDLSSKINCTLDSSGR